MKFTDKEFKGIFIFLLTVGFTLAFILGLHLLISVPINSKPLWVGSLIMLIAINVAYDISSIIGKVITLFITIILMTLFFTLMLNWSLTPGIYVASMIVSLVTMLYFTFLL